MRLFALAALLPVLASGACKEIRVLTYNIHHGEGIDGRFDLERIAKVINDARADVVALQEVDQKTTRTGGVDTLTTLSSLTRRTAVFGKAIAFQGGEYGNALLVRGRILRWSVHAIPTTPGREARSILRAEVRLRGCRAPILVLATHLDNDAQADRMAGARLAHQLAQQADDLPALLLGDFNAAPDNPAVRFLSSSWMISGASPPIATYPVEQPRVQIDYILARPSAAWRLRETRVLDERTASDHRPLLTVFRLFK